MMDLDITFDQSPWEAFLRTKQLHDTVNAGELLALLEGEDDQALEDAFLQLEEGCMELSILDLPKGQAAGEAALRLRREAQLSGQALRPELFEEDDPLRLYLEELAAVPVCGDERLLASRASAGDENARIALTNLGLSRVVELAREHVGYGVLLLDLIQEGSLGLWQAVGSFRGGDYSLWRDRQIRFALAKAVTAQARAMGAGQRMRAALEDYRQVDERLLSELGRNPTLEEIALEMHMSLESAYTVKKMLDDAYLMAQAKGKPQVEEEPEEADQAVENTALFQMRQRISDLLCSLTPQDARLLSLRFGLEGGLPKTPAQVGEILNLTPEEVVAREAAALAMLRNNKEG